MQANTLRLARSPSAAVQSPLAALSSACAAFVQGLMEDDEDRRERHLAMSVDHQDFANRERAWDDSQARARAMRVGR